MRRSIGFALAASFFLVTACRGRSCEQGSAPQEVAPAASVQKTIRDLGAPPSECLDGPSDAKRLARLNPVDAGFDPDPNELLPQAALATLDDRVLVPEVATRISYKALERGRRSLSPAERTIYLAYWLKSEVANGGFAQFFFNSSGDCASLTAAAAREIGAEDVAVIVERAIAKFPGGRPAEDRSTRWRQMDGINDASTAWRADDEAFWKIDSAMWKALQRYVRAKLGELDVPPRRP